MAQLSRNELDAKYTWDFSDIYATDEVWETTYTEVDAMIPRIAAIQGTLGASAESMKAGLTHFLRSWRRQSCFTFIPCFV